VRKSATLLVLAVVALVAALWAALTLRAFEHADSAIVAIGATISGHTLFLYQEGEFRSLTAPGVDVMSLAPSAHSQTVAFVFRRRQRFVDGPFSIGLLDLSDMRFEVVAPEIPNRLHVLTGYSSVAWSPDGREILFTAAYRNDHEEAGLYLLDVASHTVRAAPIQYEEEACGRGIPCLRVDVSWAPGPTPLLSVCRLHGNGECCEILGIDPDTWATWPILADGRRPQWVPGRPEIAYECSTLNLESRTCIYSLHDRESRFLANGPSYGSWSPGGDYLAFVDYFGPTELSRVTMFQPSTRISFDLYRSNAIHPLLDGQLVWISQ
jgi:hypothetical protein